MLINQSKCRVRIEMTQMTPKSLMYEQFARVGRALGNATRLELLDLLAQGPRTVELLAKTCGVTVGMASQHLRVLREAGLVDAQRRGTFVTYRLAGEDVGSLLALVRTSAVSHLSDAERAVHEFLGDTRDPVESVDAEHLLARVRDGSSVVIDVRPSVEFEAGHIPGSLSIPLDELEARLSEIPPGKEAIAYCRGAYCVLALDAARILTRHGRAASRASIGLLEWRLSGRAVDASAA